MLDLVKTSCCIETAGLRLQPSKKHLLNGTLNPSISGRPALNTDAQYLHASKTEEKHCQVAPPAHQILLNSTAILTKLVAQAACVAPSAAALGAAVLSLPGIARFSFSKASRKVFRQEES